MSLRATAEQVKAAILRSDVEVRESAVCYFCHSPQADATIMPLVIQAYQQYGQDAFSIPNVWSDLPQTSETLDWIIAQLKELIPATTEVDDRFVEALVSGLYRAEASLLEPRLATIRALVSLDEEALEIIEDRVSLSTLTSDQLWSELLEYCTAREDDQEVSKADSEFADTVIENLSRYPADVAPKVLMILQDGDGSQGYLLDDLVTELAGRLRLETAIPLLLTRLGDPDAFSSEAAHRALENIGSDRVVSELERRYGSSDLDFRLAMATTLEDIHTDLSARTSLELYEQEEDADLKGLLLQAALLNFATEAIEPSRLFIQSQPKSPEQLEVRTALLTACQLLGETFPEMEEWLEDSKHDTEFRRQWYKDHPLNWAALEDDEIDENAPFESDDLEEELDDEPDTETIRRGDERIGRNDPCPCGSGKKYKKCCARREEPDGRHASVMSRTREPEKVHYPIGTIANYGPDDKTTTKIVAGVIKHEGSEAIIERWVGSRITQNPKVQRQIKEFFARHHVSSVVISEGNMGCPHEEGPDFPQGQDCPFCPYWAGKQGSNRTE